MQRAGRLVLILVTALGFAAPAVFAQTPLAATDSASRAALLDSVGRARTRWESARPQLYRVRVELLCECARPLDNAPWVLVRGDSILRDSVRQDQRFLVVSQPAYYTVDGLFATLEAALRDTMLTVTTVRFDPTFGIPLSFSPRVRCVNGCSTGGWSDIHVLGFEVARDGPRTTPFLPLPLVDTSITAPSSSWPQRAWISGGLGVGTSPSGSLADVGSGWYSAGPVAVGVQASRVGRWTGEQRGDRAFLVGARTPGARVFLLGGLGLGRESSWRTCDACGGLPRANATVAVYSVEAHGNVAVAGVGVTMFGAIGPAKFRYNGLVLTLNVGWFGE